MIQKLKVPFLPPRDIEHAANELLHRFAREEGANLVPPIPIEGIIERHLKLDFGFADLRSLLGVDDVLGATWFDAGKVRIDSRLEGEEGRASFTMGHEVGHWTLHRPLYELEKLNVSLLPSEVPGVGAGKGVACRSRAGREPAEVQANMFAAYVLMPARLVRDCFRSSFGDPVVIEGLAEARKAEVGVRPPSTWREVAKSMIEAGFTNVSNEAMRYRLAELGLVVDAVEHSDRLL